MAAWRGGGHLACVAILRGLAALATATFLLGAGTRAMEAVQRGSAGPVYSVDQVRAAATQNPRAWMGRVVLVRGVAGIAACLVEIAGSLTLCSIPRPRLAGAGPAGAAEPLPLALAGPDSLLAAWRLVPSQAVHWDAVATYRVQVRAVPVDACTSLPWLPTPNSVLDQTHCPGYEAVLVDAAPGSP